MRVAVAQFATSLNVQENLASCLRMINEASVCEPDLIVLPEYCNTLPCYTDHNQAWEQALTIEGDFLHCIAEQAKKHHCYLVLNITLRRDATRDLADNKQNSSIKSNISVTSCLFSPCGKLIHQADKQTLIGSESDFFIGANKAAKVITTAFGQLGLLAGNDDTSFAPSHTLAAHGAQLLCHSLSSFALDQSRLHGPARACENNVFLASANKVGALVSKKELAQQDIPQAYLVGVGQSQIVAPNGKVLAKLSHNDEGFIFADIDLPKSANNSNRCRPDGTELISQRRPELYQQLTLPMRQAPQHKENNVVPITANVAIFATYKSNQQAIDDVCHYIENNLSDIIQLPELFFVDDKTSSNNFEQIALVASLSKQLIAQVSAVLRPFQYVCTSLVIEGAHQAVLISEHGLLATQQQLHFCKRYQWTKLGDEINIIELPLEQGLIKVAMLTADDANIPEIVKVAALHGIHLLLIPFDIQEPCEVEYSLLSRAAENRICILAASREKSFANDLATDNSAHKPRPPSHQKKGKAKKATGLIANLTTDSALLTQWQSRKFDGYINQPLVKYQHGKITKAVIHPIAACNKRIT